MSPKLPIEAYIFVLSRLRYLSAAVTNIPDFKPDGQLPAAFTGLPALCEQAYSTLLTPFNQAQVAGSTMRSAWLAGHEASVSVYACMKSCYRQAVSQAGAIRSLPKRDTTPDRTLVRMRSITDLWVTLPHVPGTNQPLVVGELTAGAFGSLTTDFSAKLSAAKVKESIYAGALALFHEKLRAWNRLVSAAATQGRSLYKPGTPQRAYIDRIPTSPSTHQPETPLVTMAVSPYAGAVHLAFTALHATSYQVWHKGPGEPVFTQVADVLEPGEYVHTGLPAGLHEYKVVGENSSGTGPACAPVSIAVAAEQVA